MPTCCEALAKDPHEGNRKARNGYHDVLQQASIAGHLGRAGWLSLREESEQNARQAPLSEAETLCLVEFGAGSAHLSHFIAAAAEERIDLHVLVDRQAVRRTADSRLRNGVGHDAVKGPA